MVAAPASSAAAALFVLFRRGLFRGQLFKLYVIVFFLFRFATEFIRPEPKLWFGLTGYQWAAVAFVPLFGVLWRHDERHKQIVAVESQVV